MEAGEEGNKTRLAARNEMLSNETKFAFEFSEIPSVRARERGRMRHSKRERERERAPHSCSPRRVL